MPFTEKKRHLNIEYRIEKLSLVGLIAFQPPWVN